ncbi:sensor histidine kinase [Saxibacter everestensis]|uniref:histidine kinase n=1 Tax=Saxibacter everestensis TaxID=2909229 RepID=A0ABY8QZ01_9MICO|nr:sensor histidine kinase [Brevibacteriaceae bacterium ZFBP1038]
MTMGEPDGYVPSSHASALYLRIVPIAVIQLGFTFAVAHWRPDDAGFSPLNLTLLLAGVLLLPFRYRFPVWVLAGTLATTLGYILADGPKGPFIAAFAMSGANALIRGHRRSVLIAFGITFLALPWLDFMLGRTPAPSWIFVMAVGAWLAVLFTVTELVRQRRLRAADEMRKKKVAESRRADEERVRIARELHDSVAHNMALINLQAGIALHLADELPEQTRSALTTIRTSSKEALVELRSILGVLRSVDSAAERAPVAGLARLDDLVKRADAAGIAVALSIDGDPGRITGTVDRSAYRIIQEALTNVAKHSNRKQAAITIEIGAQAVDLTVTDPGTASTTTTDLSEGGNGLIGMRERAAAVGGSLTAGPELARGWTVHARLPLDAEGS